MTHPPRWSQKPLILEPKFRCPAIKIYCTRWRTGPFFRFFFHSPKKSAPKKVIFSPYKNRDCNFFFFDLDENWHVDGHSCEYDGPKKNFSFFSFLTDFWAMKASIFSHFTLKPFLHRFSCFGHSSFNFCRRDHSRPSKSSSVTALQDRSGFVKYWLC